MLTHTKTGLCLDSFREFLGIDPLLFMNLTFVGCDGYQDDESICAMSFYQFPGKRGSMNRESFSKALAQAESKIASTLGTFVAPTWVCNECVGVESFFDIKRPYNQVSVEKQVFRTSYNSVINFGQEKIENIGSFSLNYGSTNDDNFNDYAEITITTDEPIQTCNLKLYHENHFGDCLYEICPFEIVNESVEDGQYFYTIRINSWILIRPELYLNKRWKNELMLGACDDIYITNIDVGYSTVDTCKPHGYLYYKNNPNCTEGCEETAVPFCVIPIDKCEGTFRIKLGSLNDEGCFVQSNNCTFGRPSRLCFSYQAGCSFGDCVHGCCYTDCPIDAVYKLATALLPSVFCVCDDCKDFSISYYQSNAAIEVTSSGVKYRVPMSLLTNPFGTRLGEIEAYQDLLIYAEKLCNYEL